MKTVELDVRGNGIKRYVLQFKNVNKGRFGSFFSVGFESSDCDTAYDRITENAMKRYSFEVCSIGDPEQCVFYELVERGYVLAENLFDTLANILVTYGFADRGTPIKFIFNEFGATHSVLIMNAGVSRTELLKNPSKDTHFETVVSLWNEFSDIEIDNNDLITTHWSCFEQGTSRFDIWRWFEESFGYSVYELNRA